MRYDSLNQFAAFVATIYARPVSPSVRLWCPQWRSHPEAVYRLTALWRAFEALPHMRSDAAMAGWLANYADPIFGQLVQPEGAFHGCNPDAHQDRRAYPDGLPTTPTPDDWQPPLPVREPQDYFIYRTLPAFLNGFLTKVYNRPVGPTKRAWCPNWWAHPEAVFRLDALWGSWELITETEGAMAQVSASHELVTTHDLCHQLGRTILRPVPS